MDDLAQCISNINIRENKYPSIEEIVIVNVQSINETGITCRLLEYNNIEGMILSNEISRKKARNTSKLFKIGKLEVVMVLAVDEKRGYIDLSKRQTSSSDIEECFLKWERTRNVYSIMRSVSSRLNIPIQNLYNKIIWPLTEIYKHAYIAFEKFYENPEILHEITYLEKELEDILLNEISLRMAPKSIKYQAIIQVTCFTREGIDSIKTALLAGLNNQDKTMSKVSIYLNKPPEYFVSTFDTNEHRAILAINHVCNIIEKEIGKLRGGFNIKVPPSSLISEKRIISETKISNDNEEE